MRYGGIILVLDRASKLDHVDKGSIHVLASSVLGSVGEAKFETSSFQKCPTWNHLLQASSLPSLMPNMGKSHIRNLQSL